MEIEVENWAELIAFTEERETEVRSLREQNKVLLEALKKALAVVQFVQTQQAWSVAPIVRAAIAKAEARGGSRADGPLLKEEPEGEWQLRRRNA